MTPSEELLTLLMVHPINSTTPYKTAKTLITRYASILTDAVIKKKESNETVNSSLCTISSLEVYRGRGQAIAIEHSVFILSDSGTIKVRIVQSANVGINKCTGGYITVTVSFLLQISTASIKPYQGELYRMNISCSDDRLTENGCLFFKVHGVTNITKG